MCEYCDDEVTQTSYEVWEGSNNDDPTYCPLRHEELVGDYNRDFDAAQADAKHKGRDYDSDDWTNDLEAVSSYMQELWPSLYEDESWEGNEVRVFLRNNMVEVSVSEYCGLTALSLSVSENAEDYGQVGIATHWIEQVADKFLKTFGEYSKVGTFSNGESVYEKVEK
jgi:hypothetical protein